MSSFLNILRLAGIVIIAVGGLHVALGLQADLLLGAGVSEETRIDPSLDSQNRFYGAAFSLYGFLLLLVSRDLKRYGPVLDWLLTIFWFAGGVRLISMALLGLPSPLLLGLLTVELVIPPILLSWHRRLRTRAT